MAEEIKKTEETTTQDAQKLNDEALDAVAGGGNLDDVNYMRQVILDAQAQSEKRGSLFVQLPNVTVTSERPSTGLEMKPDALKKMQDKLQNELDRLRNGNY